MGFNGSPECASFGGVTRGGAVDTRPGVPIALFPPVAVIAGVIAPGFAPNATGAGGSLVVVPKAVVEKSGPDTGIVLVFDGGTTPTIGSGFGVRLNTLGLRPANELAAGAVAGLVASSATGFVSGFTSEGPPKFGVGTGDAAGTGAAVTKEEDELLLLRGVPFVPNNGGVFGLGIADGVALALWSTNGCTTTGSGGVGLTSAGDGDDGIKPASHWPNGIFGDAGCGLSEAGFSPLTSSSSPPNTGVFARGELRSGRVLGLPKPIVEAGEGVSEGEGSVGVGCWRGVCNDRGGEGSFDGGPGGVVLRTGSDEVFDDGSESGVDCTSIEGLSAFGVLEWERDAGSGTAVGSSSSLGATSFSASPVPSCSA